MSESKHTRGPWRAEQPWSGLTAIHGPDGKLIFGLAAGNDPRPDDECSANLAVMTAAPDLYAALENVAAACRGSGPWARDHDADTLRTIGKMIEPALISALKQGGE